MAIKITDISKGSKFNQLDIRDVNKVSNSKNDDFLNKITRISEEKTNDRLMYLIKEIDTQSKKIGNNLHLSEVLKYKKLVKEFLNLAVNSSHKFSKDNFLDRRGNHRVMSIVRNVDEELEKITQDILEQEKDRLKILKRMDGIRGMLIDIFM